MSEIKFGCKVPPSEEFGLRFQTGEWPISKREYKALIVELVNLLWFSHLFLVFLPFFSLPSLERISPSVF